MKAFIFILKHVTIDAVEGVSERKLAIEETMCPGFRDSQYLNTLRNISIKMVGNKSLKLVDTSSPNYMFVPLLIKKQLSILSATILLKHPVYLHFL